ncbi:MAG TPA: hypothetical protein VLF63_02665 [Patescibacteria group bacterium]|nr:hypothetical protein [Patescibacteria group bacterium]
MRLVILYRPNSEHRNLIEDFIRDYRNRNASSTIEIIDIDSREGIAMGTLYDVVSYPAILVTTNDGTVQKIWQGVELPLMDEVASYVNA